MVFAVRDEMGAAYPELKETAERVAKVVKAEEEQFARVLQGLDHAQLKLHEARERAVNNLYEKTRDFTNRRTFRSMAAWSRSDPELAVGWLWSGSSSRIGKRFRRNHTRV